MHKLKLIILLVIEYFVLLIKVYNTLMILR